MNDQNATIIEDVKALYGYMYTLSQCKGADKIFGEDILKRLVHKPKTVNEVLEFTKERTLKQNRHMRPEIAEICTKEQATSFFNSYLFDACRADITEEERKKILKSASMDEIKYLYQIIIGSPMEIKGNKIEIVKEIKRFIDDEKRTDDLTKNLY